jgi:type II secretory pathway component PulM
MYQNWLFSQWAQERVRNREFVCGTGMFALLAFCVVIAGTLSGVAALLGLAGYFRMDRPRPKKRLLEIMLISSVVVFAFMAGTYLV